MPVAIEKAACRMVLQGSCFQGQVETVMWILEEAPDSATIRNADEMAALHILV